MTEALTTETNAPTGLDSFATAPAAETPKIDFGQFLQSTPKEFQELASKNGVKDIETLTKSYTGLNSLIGKKGLIKPAENAAPEEMEAYNKALYKEVGVPDNGEYEFDLPSNLDDKYIDQNFLNELAGIASQNGVGQKAFQGIIDKVYGAYAQMIEEGSKPADFSELQKEWGGAYEQKQSDALAVLNASLSPKDPRTERVLEAVKGNPDLLYAYAQTANRFGVREDRIGANASTSIDVSTLQSQAMEKTAKAWDLYNKGDFAAAQALHNESLKLTEQYSMLKK